MRAGGAGSLVIKMLDHNRRDAARTEAQVRLAEGAAQAEVRRVRNGLAQPENIPSFDWTSTLTPRQRLALNVLGSGGLVRQFLTKYAWLRDAFNEGDWLGVIREIRKRLGEQELEEDLVARTVNRHARPGRRILVPRTLTPLAIELELYRKFGYEIRECTHGSRHWYVYHARGRSPEACWFHQNAARAERHRTSPAKTRRPVDSPAAQQVQRGDYWEIISALLCGWLKRYPREGQAVEYLKSYLKLPRPRWHPYTITAHLQPSISDYLR